MYIHLAYGEPGAVHPVTAVDLIWLQMQITPVQVALHGSLVSIQLASAAASVRVLLNARSAALSLGRVVLGWAYAVDSASRSTRSGAPAVDTASGNLLGAGMLRLPNLVSVAVVCAVSRAPVAWVFGCAPLCTVD